MELGRRIASRLRDATFDRIAPVGLANAATHRSHIQRSVLDLAKRPLGAGDAALIVAAGPSLHRRRSLERLAARGFELEARRMAGLMRDKFNVAFIDVGGWDTHVNQGAPQGQLANRLDDFARGLAALVTDLGSRMADTVVLTGGSTSGCIRAGAVESLSRGYRTIVPEQCVADKHESYHFANLTDLMLKYADVVDVQEVKDYLDQAKKEQG